VQTSNPSINVAEKSVYDRIFLLRNIFNLLLKNIDMVGGGSDDTRDALISRLNKIIQKVDKLLETSTFLNDYNNMIKALEDKLAKYRSEGSITYILAQFKYYILNDLIIAVGDTLALLQDLTYKSGMTGSVLPYEDENVQQPYADFIPTDDYFAWNTAATSSVNNGLDKVFIIEDYLTKIDNSIINIYDVITFREPHDVMISLRKHGQTGDTSPSKIYCKINDGDTIFDKEPELIQRELSHGGIICDFVMDVDSKGITYGMINCKTGEKTILIEDMYRANVKSGVDESVKTAFTSKNLIDVDSTIPDFVIP